MKPAYQVLLMGTDQEQDTVRALLSSVFPSIFVLREDKYTSSVGPMRNIRAYVELEEEGVLTAPQVQALRSLGLEVKEYLFSMRWEEGELEAAQAKEREKSLKEWEELIKLKYPNAQYFLCYFRQNVGDEFSLGDGSITVHFIHPDSFPMEEQDRAEARATELEKARYEKKDFNVQIVARPAESAEKARQGVFLDYDTSRADWYAMGRI